MGLGEALVVELAKKGWKVYAGCRTQAGVDKLNGLGLGSQLIPLVFDVTKEEDISRVFAKIDAENAKGLYCLVNNAGVMYHGPVDWVDMDTFRFMMEVNYLSVVNVTKRFLPLLQKFALQTKEARIVIVGSASGSGWGLQQMSGYAASKHAVESFASSLRGEMAHWNIKVSSITPMVHRTDMADIAATAKDIGRTFDKLPEEKKEAYGIEYLQALQDCQCSYVAYNAWDPITVTRDMVHACTAITPRAQYQEGLLLLTIGFITNNLPRPLTEWLHGTMGGQNSSGLVPKVVKIARTKGFKQDLQNPPSWPCTSTPTSNALVPSPQLAAAV